MKIKPLKWARVSGSGRTAYQAKITDFGRYVIVKLQQDRRWTVLWIHGGGCDKLPTTFATTKLAKQAAEAHWHAKLMEVLEP